MNVSWTGAPVPGRVLVGYRTGLAIAWLWLAIMLATGFDNWTPERSVPVLFDPDGLRLPWRTWAWIPVWSPVPALLGGGMGWLCLVLATAALALLANRRARPAAAVLLLAYGWMVGLDSVLMNAHRYLLVCMTVAFLLLPTATADIDVPLGSVLPIPVLAVALWGWAAWAKTVPAWRSGPALYLDLVHLNPPWLGTLWSRLPGFLFLAGAWLVPLAETAIAWGLTRPARARTAARAGIALCVFFLPLVPVFAVATATLTWAAGRCVGMAVPTPTSASAHRLEGWRLAAIVLFCAWQFLLPIRTHLIEDNYATGRGWFWAWRQMTMLRHGFLRVEVLDPEHGWQDATGPLAPIMEDLLMFPCEIPWGVAWVRRSRPDLLPPDRSVRVLRLGGGGPAVPASCPPGRVPNPGVG